MPTQLPVRIQIGPQETLRLEEISRGIAPRLDYQLVADGCQGHIQPWLPAPSGLSGPRLVRISRSFLGNLGHALRLLPSLAPDSIVYSTGETWGLPMALAAVTRRNRRFTHVVYVHRVFSSTWMRFLRAARSLLVADGWICVTHYQASLLRRALGPGSAPVAVVSQGVDTAFFDPSIAVPNVERPFILSVGAEMRNYDLLFEAVRDLEVDVVVKASSAWMATGRSELTSVPPNVRVITERLSYIDLRNLYAGAALVVAPLYETPQAAGITTILEAMAMGKCVVATRSSGLPDILVHGETGIVVEPRAEVLASTLQQMMNDPEKRDALAQSGQRAVKSTVTIEHHAQQVVDFLASVQRQ